MIIRIAQHNREFSIISNAIFQNPHLTWKAKGLLGYLLTRPENWQVNVQDLVKMSTGGRDQVYGILKELKLLGYLRPVMHRERGRFAQHDWVAHENPAADNEATASGFSLSRKPGGLVNTDTKGGKAAGSARPRFHASEEGLLPLEDRYSPFIRRVVTYLENHVRKERQLNGKRFNRAKWYEDIRLLLQDVEDDKARIKSVLLTFLKSEDRQFCPRVTCADHFRSKFLAIEDWAHKQTSQPIFDRARKIAIVHSREEFDQM